MGMAASTPPATAKFCARNSNISVTLPKQNWG
jgi:hypothetical protein